MLHDLETLRDDERRQLGRCLNLLLERTFVLQRYDKDAYYFIRKYQAAIQDYLNLADWELRHDDLHQIFQAVNRHDANRRDLTRLESELLLVLCLIYLEQSAELRLTEFPVLTLSELRTRYRALLGDARRLTPTGLRDALRVLRRYRLIDTVGGRDFTPQDPEQHIILLPTLRLALDFEQLLDAQQALTIYAQTSEVSESDTDEGETAP